MTRCMKGRVAKAACVLALCVGWVGTAEARRNEVPGFRPHEPSIKWSSHLLDEGEWSVGFAFAGYGLAPDLTLGSYVSDLLLGNLNARGRLGVGSDSDQFHVALEGGVGFITPLSLVYLAVDDPQTLPALTVMDVAVPITHELEGRPTFVTVKPWIAVSIGEVNRDAAATLPLLLRRSALTGPGLNVVVESHTSKYVGVMGQADVGLDVYGGEVAFGTSVRGAVVFAGGPLRANIGFGVLAGFSGRRIELAPVPAVDVWARF